MSNDTLGSVLLVEDNPGDARLVREYLHERFGERCDLHIADTLDSALDALDTRPVDVVLLDLSLPDSHGLDTFYRVHAAAKGAPVVILTGNDDDEQGLAAVRAGAEGYLAKKHQDGVALVRSLRHAMERRQLEQALRDSEARYRTIVETAEEGIALIDTARRIVCSTARFASMLGTTASALRGRAFADLVDPCWQEAARRLVAPGPLRRRSAELRLTRHSGLDPLWVIAAAGDLMLLDGPRDEIMLMLTDISDRRRAEGELRALQAELEARVAQRTALLEAANADLQAFGASVAHDLRVPLNAMLGFASLLDFGIDGPLNDAQQRKVELIRTSAGDMNELIGGLLALGQATRRALAMEEVDLSALAASSAAQLMIAEPERHAQWHIEPGVRAQGDRVLLADVLRNLLHNAFKYSSRAAQAQIAFGMRTDASAQPVYWVRDNGIGFTMEHAARLFAPFERLVSAEGFAGSGVGLATARRIVERHGGRLWAESVPDEQTTFFFTLGAPADGTQPP